MKKMFLIYMAFIMAGIATAAWAEPSKDETRLEKDASELDKDANKPEKEKAVIQRIEKEFKVDDATINSLRDKKLGYGEITIVLALADKLGGINDTNIDKIMAMRQGPPVQGWGEIANKLGFRLGTVISTVEKVKSETHKDIEKAEREKPEKHERIERPERPEKRGR